MSAPWNFVAATTAEQPGDGVGGAMPINVPAGTQDGDLLIVVMNNMDDPSPTVPAGWTQISSDTTSGSTWYRIANSEPASYSWTFASNTNTRGVAAVMLCYTIPGGGDWSFISWNKGTTNGEDGVSPAVPTSTDSLVLVTFGGNGSYQAPTGLTHRASQTAGGGQPYCYFAWVYETTGSGATEGPWTWSGAWYNASPFADTIVFDAVALPSAPTLQSPLNASAADIVNTGGPFAAAYNNVSGAPMAGYQYRYKVSGAASYSYWNASTSAMQSTAITNPASGVAPGGTFSLTFPTGASSPFANGTTYNWSFAFANSSGLGPFASDFTVTVQQPPIVTINEPTGTVVTSQPTVSWTATFGSGLSQISYRVLVYLAGSAYTPPSGSTVDTADAVWDSGSVASSASSVKVGTPLNEGSTYDFWVQVVETNDEPSAWVKTSATVTYDTPAVPTLTATATTDPSTGAPMVALEVAGHDNLLSAEDASFEGGTVGTWGGGANSTSMVNSSAEALDGTHSLLVTMGAQPSNNNWAQQGAQVPVVGGETYTVIENVYSPAAQMLTGENATFSGGVGGWTASSSAVTMSATTAPDASPALKLVCASSGDNFARISTGMSDQATYTFSAECWVESMTAEAFGGRALLMGASNAAENDNLTTATPTGQWVPFSLTFSPAANGGEARLYAPEGTVYWRNPQIVATTNTFFGANQTFGANHSYNGDHFGPNVEVAADTWTPLIYTFIAPADGYASCDPRLNTTLPNQQFYIDACGIFPGTVTEWTRGGLAGTGTVEVQFSDDGGTTWQDVRGGSAVALSDAAVQTATVNDYESPLGLARLYRARVVNGSLASAWSATQTATLFPPGAPISYAPRAALSWLSDPSDPATAQPVRLTAFGARSRPISQSSTSVIGRQDEVVVSDVRRLRKGSMTVLTEDAAALSGLLTLAQETGRVLLLRRSAAFGEDAPVTSIYLVITGPVGEAEPTRLFGPWRAVTFTFTEQLRPA